MLIKVYGGEFMRGAVVLVGCGVAQKQVARVFGISRSAIQVWVRGARFRSHGISSSTGPDERCEISAVLKRVRELEMENEVLRCAVAYLSQAHITPPK